MSGDTSRLATARRHLRLAVFVLLLAGVGVASLHLAYEIGLADARLDRPIVCGDPHHPDGIHRVPTRWP